MRAIKIYFALCLLSISSVLFTTTAHGERLIIVDFTSATLRVLSESSDVLLTTPVVLPGGKFYPVPVTGKVRRAQMGPTWVPTENMHREFPGRYAKVYRPYENGNARDTVK